MKLLRRIRNSFGALQILYRLSGFINLFCPRFDREQNRALRRQAVLPAGMLNGQAVPPLAALPYGAWRMEKNGCEVIAVYNALLALDMPRPFFEVADALEEKGLLFNGFGGTALGAVEDYLRKSGVSVRVLRGKDAAAYDAALENADCAVLSFWTGAALRERDGTWNTLHTVFVRKTAAGTEIRNDGGHCAAPRRIASVGQYLSANGAAPVCFMLLRKEIPAENAKNA